MNRPNEPQETVTGGQPPNADVLAGEYTLGLLDAAQRREVRARMSADPMFAARVTDWERQFAGLLETIEPIAVPDHVWPRVRTRLGWSPVERAGTTQLWSNVTLWRAVAGLAASAALAVWLLPGTRQIVPPPAVAVNADPAPVIPVVTLTHDDGSPGWLASVNRERGTVQMVPVPHSADSNGRVPELWLIPVGGKAYSLGIVSTDHSHTVDVPVPLQIALVPGSVLAITLEPQGGAPGGVATGPVIAKGDVLTL